MVDEMASLHKNEAWDLVEFPAGRKPIGSEWVFERRQMQKERWRIQSSVGSKRLFPSAEN